MPISPIRLPDVTMVEPLSMGRASDDVFGGILEDAIHKVGEFHNTSTKSLDNFLSGEGEDLHKTIMATQRAELAMDLFLQVRNKVVQAYQEIMRMQV